MAANDLPGDPGLLYGVTGPPVAPSLALKGHWMRPRRLWETPAMRKAGPQVRMHIHSVSGTLATSGWALESPAMGQGSPREVLEGSCMTLARHAGSPEGLAGGPEEPQGVLQRGLGWSQAIQTGP